MKQSFEITYDDGRKVLAVAKPKDFVAFERQYDKPMTAFSGGGTHDEWLYYLAWSALHRSGSEPAAFDEFLDHVDDLEVIGDEVAPLPLAPSPETSPSSPS
jgi:hypothetical protein